MLDKTDLRISYLFIVYWAQAINRSIVKQCSVKIFIYTTMAKGRDKARREKKKPKGSGKKK